MRIYKSVSEAYLGTLRDVYQNPDYVCAPRGLKILEKTDYIFRVLEPTSDPVQTFDVERNKIIEDYTKKEFDLYMSCSNQVEDFAKASKFWKNIANHDGTINSAYGYLIWKKKSHGNPEFEHKLPKGECTALQYFSSKRTPWEWCVETLKQDKDTRQAILRFSLPEHFYLGNKDMTCTMHGNFLIRDDKLNLAITMRSNDLNKGLVYDISFFCFLIEKMVEGLKPYYPEIGRASCRERVCQYV